MERVEMQQLGLPQAKPIENALSISRYGSLRGRRHRFDNLEDYFIYPIQLSQELPIIPVPLLPGDGEVSVSL